MVHGGLLRHRTLALLALVGSVNSCSGGSSSGSVSFEETEDKITNSTTLSGTVETRNPDDILLGRVVLSCTLPEKELHFRVESYQVPESGDKLPSAALTEIQQRWGSVPIAGMFGNVADAHSSQPYDNVFDLNVTTFIAQIQAERKRLLQFAAQYDSIQPLKVQVMEHVYRLDTLFSSVRNAGLERVVAEDGVPEGSVAPHGWTQGLGAVRYCYLNGGVGFEDRGVCNPLPPLPAELARTAAQYDSVSSIVEPIRSQIRAILKVENEFSEEANSWRSEDLVARSAELKVLADSLGLMDGASEPNGAAALIGPEWVVQYKAQGGSNSIVMATSDMRRVFDRCSKP